MEIQEQYCQRAEGADNLVLSLRSRNEVKTHD